MRIVAGKYKGRLIKLPSTTLCRPTSGMVKESLFSILHSGLGTEKSLLENTIFADICAGSGAIGLEALSRNVAKTIFIESNVTILETIRHNINHLKLDEEFYRLISSDATRLTPKLLNTQLDIAFIDPPYKTNLAQSICDNLLLNKLVKPGGIIIVETSSKYTINIECEKLKERKYGNKSLLFFRAP